MPAWTKILTSGNVTNADLSGSAGITSANIADDTIDNDAMADNSINSDQYVDRSIDTIHIGLNQVTLAEMAGGTDGNLITYDTSGNPAYVATGTATHVLTSNGADTVPTFQAVPQGDIEGVTAGSGLSGGGTSGTVSLALDIDGLSAIAGEVHQTQDMFLVSDNGTEKKITFSLLEDEIFGNVSGDATIAAGGALTIAATSVEGSMLNTNVISGQTAMTGDVVDADELMVSDGGTLKRADFSVVRDAVFNDVSGDAAVAAGGALTIAADAVTYAKMQNVSATNVLLGRDSSGAGIVEEISASNVRTILNVENGADSTETWLTEDANRTIGADGRTMTLDGNLVVSGTTTTISSTTLEVADKLVKLANVASPTTTTSDDSGIQIESSATEAEWPHIRWKNDGDLTGWGLANHVGSRVTVDHYPIAVIYQSTTTPTSQAGAGIGTLWFETDAEDLYIRTS